MAFYHQDCKVVFYDPQTKERKESGISGALVPDSLEAKTTETVSTKSSKETKAKEEPEAKEPITKEKSSRKTKEKEESEAKETKAKKKPTKKSQAKRKSKTDKTSPSTEEKESDTIEVSEEKQKIIKNLAEMGMTAKKIAKVVELPEKIVKKYMK